MYEVSVFQNFTKVVASRTIPQIIDAIRAGVYAAKVADIRRAVQLNNKTQVDRLKRTLPAFTPSGRFAGGRTLEHLIEYIPLIVLDFDKLPSAQISALRAAAEHDPYTHACFFSPSGNGLKILVRTQSTPETHTTTFNQIAAYYEELLNPCLLQNTAQDQTPFPKHREEGWGGVDRSGKDLTRLCFLSHDPQAYHNPDSKVFEPLILEPNPKSTSEAPLLEPELKSTSEASLPPSKGGLEGAARGLSYTPGSRNNYIYRFASHANRLGIPEPDTLADCLVCFDLDPKEIAATVRSAYKHHFHEHASKSWSSTHRTNHSSDNLATQLKTTPLIPPTVYTSLPSLLADACTPFSDPRERDVLLTAALAILSGCLPNISGLYDQRRQYPNIFTFIVAPAASGKSVLSFAKMLADALHQSLLNENDTAQHLYRQNFADYKVALANHQRGKTLPDEPARPPFRTLFIPANASSAMVIKHLRDNDGAGIMCETEADTLGAVLKQDWGGYSDLLRKAFHFEKISYSRKGNAEFYEIPEPRLSVAISGTPNQVLRLIPSVEDGLFSRFLFYAYAVPSHWRDVSPGAHRLDRTAWFTTLSERVLELHAYFESYPCEFDLTPRQWQHLNNVCTERLESANVLFGQEADSTVKRLGAMLFRLAMILSALRRFEYADGSPVFYCDDADFETACALTDVYLEHALFLYEWLPQDHSLALSQIPTKRRLLFQALPDQFETNQALQIAAQMGVSERTLKRCLGNFLQSGILLKEGHGLYVKSET